MTQGFGEPDACLVCGDRLCGGIVKPRLGRIGKVFIGIDVLFEFDEPIGLRGSRHGVVIVAGDEEFVNAKTILSHHGFRRERGVGWHTHRRHVLSLRCPWWPTCQRSTYRRWWCSACR